jgi:hypothetical protein
VVALTICFTCAFLVDLMGVVSRGVDALLGFLTGVLLRAGDLGILLRVGDVRRPAVIVERGVLVERPPLCWGILDGVDFMTTGI